MAVITKRIITVSILLCALLINLTTFHVAEAAGNPKDEAAQQAEEAKEKAEQEAREKVEKEAESKGDVAEPPSGPNVNVDTVTEEVEIDTPASVTGQKVDGTGTVTDFSTSGSKAFYTITDQNHNVFYLIIDLDKTDNNVYFLSDIDKSDLTGPATDQDAQPSVMPDQQVQSEVIEPEPKGGGGFLMVVFIIALGAVGAYYFFVMKPKQKKATEDGEEEMMDEDYEDDFYDDEMAAKEQP